MTSAVAPADQRDERARAACPYRGLVPFFEEDADYFFGRGAEREIIAANLIASRLTLLYAASGVGKSSVLLAGVLHDLRAMAADDVVAGVAPEYVPVVVRRWREDPVGTVRESVRRALGAGAPAGETLAETLAAWTRGTDATVLLILDQFEEFLLYHGDRWAPGEPAEQLARLISSPDLPLNVLIALREDALAGLDRFKGRVPHLFENYLRLKHLDREAAREAIEMPIGEWNRRRGAAEAVTLEPGLVDAVLDQLGEGRVALARGGGKGQTAGATATEIEASFLQLVLMRVWEEERAEGSIRLREATLEALEGADRIVGTYLDEQMDRLPAADQAIASAVFRQLVTPSGTKIAHSLGDLADYTGVAPAELRGVLDKLAAGDDWRILRSESGHDGPASRNYEIFHDVLAEAVLDWRGRFEEQRAASEAVAVERLATRRRRRRLVVVALVLGAVAAILLVVALILLNERRKAADARDAARSSRLVGAARALLADDPELAIILARRAGIDTPDAVQTLRTALTQHRARGVLPSDGGPVHDIDASPDGAQLVGAYRDGHIRIWDVASARIIADRAAGQGTVTSARFSPDGAFVLTATSGGDIRTWSAADGSSLRSLSVPGEHVSEPRWSSDGRRVLARTGRSASVWDARTGRLLRTFRSPGGRVTSARWGTSPREVAIASFRGLELRSVASGRADLQIPMGPVLWIRVSDDGAHLVVRQPARVWLMDLRRRVLRKLRGPRFAVDTQFSNDGKRLAVAFNDQRIRIYNTANGRLRTIVAGAVPIGGVRFTPDKETLLTIGPDRSVRVWDVRTGDQRAVLPGRVKLTGLTTFPGGPFAGRIVSTARDGAIRIWEPSPSSSVLESPVATREARFARGGRAVIAATARSVSAWDTPPAPSNARGLAAAADVLDVDVGPGGRSVVAVDTRRGRVFDLRGGRELSPPLDPARKRERPVAAAFSPDGRYIATADVDGAASLWSGRDHAQLGRVGAPRPAGSPRFGGHITFAADGALLAISGASGAVRLFDVATGKPVRSFKKLPARGAFVFPAPIAAQPGGDLLAVGGGDGSTRLYDVRTGAMHELPPIDEQILDLTFNPDGRILATASSNGGLRLWDVGSRRHLGVFFADADPLWSVDVSADGASVLALGDDNAVRVFACDVCGSDERLLRAAQRRVTRDLTADELKQYDPDG